MPVEFQTRGSLTAVAIEPDSVKEVLPFFDDRAGSAIIYLSDGTRLGVVGNYKDVMRKLFG